MLQLLLSRIFSVTTWYHVSFLVISIAMFGMTLGALKVYRDAAEMQRATVAQLASRYSFFFALAIPATAVAALTIPIVDAKVVVTLVFLPIVAFLTSVPFYFSGFVVALCLTRSSFKVSAVYGYDLVGAAAGCISALALMKVLDTPSALLVLAAAPALAGLCFAKSAQTGPAAVSGVRWTLMSAVAVGLAGLGVLNGALPAPLIYPMFPKGTWTPQSALELDRWNSISRITILQEEKDSVRSTGARPQRCPRHCGPHTAS